MRDEAKSLETHGGAEPAGRPLKIGIVTETYPPDVNGCAMTMGRLVNGLLARGHSVQLFRPRRGPDDVHRTEGMLETVPLAGLPIPGYRVQKFGLPAPCSLTHFWGVHPVDVIYVATEGPLGRSTIHAAKLRRIPVVSGFHTNWLSYTSSYGIPFLGRLLAWYLRRFHRRSACVLCPTEDLREKLVERGYGNVEVLSRGADTELFSPAKRDPGLRAEWGAGETDTVILYVGRLAEEKNLSLAVEAFDAVRKVRPEARFVLVGDGPSRDGLERKRGEFIFSGFRTGEDLARHYASGDVFLFPSLSETFGNVTIEAAASGLAIVAFDYAAAHMHLTDGESALLAACDDPVAFVAAAARLAGEPALVARLRERARQVAESISWDRICDEFEGVLLSCARQRTGT
jgi:glycosyltransferase involved in cell wall biosynthesis